MSTGLLLATRDGRAVWTNPAFERLLGSDDAAAGTIVSLARSNGDIAPVEVRWTAPDGDRRWLRVRQRPLAAEYEDAADGHVLYECEDVTEHRDVAERARTAAHRLARVEALAGVGTWEWDVATGDVTWSDALLTMFGYAPDIRLDYDTYRSLVHPDDLGDIERTLESALDTGDPFEYTHRMYLADRTTMRVFECHGEVTIDDDGAPLRILGTAHDITEKRRVQDRLQFLAEHDPLTGLRNRRSVTAYLDEHFGTESSQMVALLLIDIDNFKDINDLRGHAVGDRVMRSLGRLLREQVASDVVLGRLGGDEFAVVMASVDERGATAAAEALRAAIARHTIVSDPEPVRVTASIGVAVARHTQHPEVVLSNADLALYEAKRAGRDRVRLFAPEQYQLAAERVSEVQRVRDALDHSTMALYAQPIVDLATRRVIGHEVLLRLHDGLAPTLGPAEFLAAVERTDLMVRLDRWVVDRAVAALATAGARRGNLHLAINVSSRSLDDKAFAEYVIDALHAADVAPDRLGLEITETAAITSLDAAGHLISRLTSAGC